MSGVGIVIMPIRQGNGYFFGKIIDMSDMLLYIILQ